MKLMGTSAQLAKKYARAFMNLFAAYLQAEDYKAIEACETFLIDNAHVMLIFKMPFLDHDKKNKFLMLLAEQFKLPKSVQELMKLLLRHGRIDLLKIVFYMIRLFYNKQHHIMLFSISTSYALSHEELGDVQKFLAHKTGQTILYNYTIDATLISGIRAQSDTLLWECSIRRRLRIARRALMPV